MSFLKERATKREKEFMKHIRKSIVDRLALNKEFSLEEYTAMLLNSYELKLIEPHLSDEALVWKIENSLKNCSTRKLTQFELSKHYDEWILADGIYEILKRFKEK